MKIPKIKLGKEKENEEVENYIAKPKTVDESKPNSSTFSDKVDDKVTTKSKKIEKTKSNSSTASGKVTNNITENPEKDDKINQTSSMFSKKYNGKENSIQNILFLKKLVNKKLTIILIENTCEVANEKETLNNIIKNLVSEGLVSVINYGTTVRQSKIVDVSDFKEITILYDSDIGNQACLYDALVNLEDLFSKEYMQVKEGANERVKINKIEIIGIGTCRDNCSNISKEGGIESFCKIANNAEVITKYFCLTEEYFMNAAEIGFRSIGAIFRNY